MPDVGQNALETVTSFIYVGSIITDNGSKPESVVALFIACGDLGKMFDYSFPACTFFFFYVEIRLYTLIPLLRPGSVHSSSAS